MLKDFKAENCNGISDDSKDQCNRSLVSNQKNGMELEKGRGVIPQIKETGGRAYVGEITNISI